jgi:NAD(P)-dependent dehydrogenase (short-subunit alcohol dehydrogenase family)
MPLKKILVIGATGTIGQAVATALEADGEVLRASRRSALPVDLENRASLRALLERVGTVDAIVNCTGAAPFKPLPELTAEDVEAALLGKSLTQTSLVTEGLEHVADGGSFTLVSGILTQHPVPASVAASTANGAVEAFVAAAANELPRGVRINAVSPNVLRESPGHHAAFKGFTQVTAAEVAQAFVRSVHGIETGQVFRVWG